MGAKYTEAQKRASQKYKEAAREKLTLDIPKGSKERYKAHAEKRGKSLTSLFVDLIERDIKELE